jgi:hypothetical protein
MKRAALFVSLVLASPAFGQGLNFNVPGMTDAQKQALQSMMGPVVQASTQFQGCVNGKLGQDGMQRISSEAKIMNREVVAHCKAGRRAEAREVAMLYSQTIEGEAAWSCGRQLKPYLQNPQVQQTLGRYLPMVRQLADGQLPQDVCTGLTN